MDDTFLVKKSWSISNTLKLPKKTFKTICVRVEGFLMSIISDLKFCSVDSWIIFWRESFGSCLEKFLKLICWVRCGCRTSPEWSPLSGPLAKVPHQRGQRQQSQVTWVWHVIQNIVILPSYWCHVTLQFILIQVISTDFRTFFFPTLPGPTIADRGGIGNRTKDFNQNPLKFFWHSSQKI